MTSIAARIAEELAIRTPQAEAAIALLDAKSTVPFIARYRKEATGGLDDTQLRTLEERLHYLRDLEERRAAIRKSIEDQGKLSPELDRAIAAADTKARLEDLYLPYKPKRRTKSQIAREAGLEPLALALLSDPTLVPDAAALPYVDAAKGVAGRVRRSRRRALDSRRHGSPRMPSSSAAFDNCSGIAASGRPPSSTARRRRAPSSPTTSTPASR